MARQLLPDVESGREAAAVLVKGRGGSYIDSAAKMAVLAVLGPRGVSQREADAAASEAVEVRRGHVVALDACYTEGA